MARILVVDDEQDMAEVVRLVLETAGHEVRVQLDPTLAVGTAREFAPQAILLDLVMPGLDGHQVFRALREEEVTKTVPIAFLTSRGKRVDLMVGLHVLGAQDYLTKPFDRIDLLTRVNRLLANSPA